MAIAKVANSSGLQSLASTPTLSASLPNPPAQGALLIAYVWGWNVSASLSLVSGDVTDNHGNAFTLAVLGNGGSGGSVAIFYLVVPATYSGTYTVTLAPGQTSGNYLALDAEEYAGNGNTPLDQTATASSSGSAVTSGASGTTPATASTCQMWTAALMVEDRATTADNISTPTGFTVRAVNQNGSGNIYPGQAADEIASTGLSGVAASASWTWATAAPYVGVIATWVPGTYVPPVSHPATGGMLRLGAGS